MLYDRLDLHATVPIGAIKLKIRCAFFFFYIYNQVETYMLSEYLFS